MSAKLRAGTLAQIAADIHMHGLPAPISVHMTGGVLLEIRIDNEEPVGVDLWAKHLDMGQPTETEYKGTNGRAPWLSRQAQFDAHMVPAWNAPKAWRELGWRSVRVWSAIHPSSKAVQS